MSFRGLSRLHLLSVVIVLFAAALVSRLFFIQIVEGKEYELAANRQYVTPSSQVFDRGTIFFRDKGGELVSAATLQSGYLVAINPKEIKDAPALYAALSGVLPLSREEFMEKAGKQDDPYEEVARRVSEATAETLTALSKEGKLPGVSVYRERWRFYPAGELAARILGYVGYNNDDALAGRYGLERYYEGVLARDGEGLYVNFFAEMFSNLGDSIFRSAAREGDIVVTIEPTVEKALHDELAGVMEEWGSDLAGGVIIDPVTGDIYAMEVLPGFNPNNMRSLKDPKVLSNPLVENVYEMGSIMKPIVMAAALDAGAVSPQTVYTDYKGFVEIDGAIIRNFDGKGRGTVSMQEVLSQSLNTGMVFVERELGHGRFRDYMRRFGIGEETGIDLPGETHGLVSNLTSTRDVEYATASFGQGIALTPLETVRALAALGNGGTLISPHLIDTIDYKGGLSRKPEYTDGKAVIGTTASEDITRMLVEVVDKALLGGAVKIPEYSVAAKTGTAQMAREDGRGYYEDRYLHSFFGYFPAYDPKFLVFLYTVDPKGATFASHTLTYPFIRLTKFLLNYYEIPPDRMPISAGRPDRP